MNRVLKRRIGICLSICLILLLGGMSFPSFAEERETKTVRVGYLLSPGYQEGGEGEYKSGQGYEYLQKIAGYAGWTYEYVYGDFSELLVKLENGEIDLMGNLSITEDRAELISFGQYEQGKESFYLYVCGDTAGIRSNDYSTINGKKIGVSVNSFQEKLWTDWCEKNHIQCELVEFASAKERADALNNGRIDGTLDSLLLNATEETKNWRSVLKFGDSPYFFGVNKARPDLLEDLNKAQSMILDENPYYNEELSTQYLRNSIITRTQLRDNEIEWLKDHNGQIRIGCLDGYLPISDQDEKGERKGVIIDLLKAIEEQYTDFSVHFDIVMYSDYREMLSDLKEEKLDLAAPIYGDCWNAEQEGIALTDSFMSTTMLLLNAKNVAPQNIRKIGIDMTSPIQSFYAQIYYPQYERIQYSSMGEVAQALVDGRIDVALSSASNYHLLAKLDRNIKNLNRATLPETVNMTIAAEKKDPELVSFMNRAIMMIGETQIFNSLAINSNVDTRTTLADYVAENPVTAILVSGFTILGLLIIIIRMKKAIKRSRTDTMTGLLNKIAMHERVREEMHRGGILFMIDIDDFKRINDILGHQAGDEVITFFASSLQEIFRSGDLIGRFGGDEFMVFLPGASCTEETVKKKVDQMQKALEQCAVFADGRLEPSSVSAGVVVLEANPEISYVEAFEKADAALYEAKKNGKNTYSMSAI